MSNTPLLYTGDRLIRRKGLVNHHGIYVGIRNAQHTVAENGPQGVRYVSYEAFLAGHPLEKVIPFEGTVQMRANVIPFIESKIGTQYSLLTYNCEHFASEVQGKGATSQQVRIGVLLAGLGLLFYLSKTQKSS